jgi:hypothetical protein
MGKIRRIIKHLARNRPAAIKCYGNATQAKIVRPFYVRSKELMIGVRRNG